MTIRVYLMPRIGTGLTREDGKRAKYRSLLSNSSVLHYGPEPYCIVVSDVDAAQHSAVIANADVNAFPANLDTTLVTATRTAVVNALEAASIPAGWVVNGMTFRTVLRRLAGIFFLLQNVSGRKFRLLQIALNDPISSLPTNARQAMLDAATLFGLDTTGITGSTTLRAALTSIGSQFATRPFVTHGQSF